MLTFNDSFFLILNDTIMEQIGIVSCENFPAIASRTNTYKVLVVHM
jgi:hypothetical protein